MRRERRPDLRIRVEACPCSRGTRPVPIATEFGLQGRMDILSSAGRRPAPVRGPVRGVVRDLVHRRLHRCRWRRRPARAHGHGDAAAVVLPVHTVVMLGSGFSRTVIMWRHVMRPTVLPFVIGSVIGAAAGARVFVALTTTWLRVHPRRLHPAGDLDAEARAVRRRTRPLRRCSASAPRFSACSSAPPARCWRRSSPRRRRTGASIVATMGALMMTSHLAKVAAFGFIGFAIGRYRAADGGDDRDRRGRQLGRRGGAAAHDRAALPPGVPVDLDGVGPASALERGPGDGVV